MFCYYVSALLYGDPQRLLSPTDTVGKKCGFDPGVEDKPYLHFFDISKCANPIVFIAGCPTHQVTMQLFVNNYAVSARPKTPIIIII